MIGTSLNFKRIKLETDAGFSLFHLKAEVLKKMSQAQQCQLTKIKN